MDAQHVFISYATEDRTAATLLNQFLKDNSILTWIDFERLTPGKRWKIEISDAIRTARAVVFLSSAHSINKKGYVQRELKQILEKIEEYPLGDIVLLVARIDETHPRESVLQEIQWVDLFNKNQAKAYGEILGALFTSSEEAERRRDLEARGSIRGDDAEGTQDIEKANQLSDDGVRAKNTTGTLFHPDDFDLYCNKITGEFYIFHGPVLEYEVSIIEYDFDIQRIAVVLGDGTRLDLGVKVQWMIRPCVERAENVYIIQTKNGEAITGIEVSVKKVGERRVLKSAKKNLPMMRSMGRLSFLSQWLDKIKG